MFTKTILPVFFSLMAIIPSQAADDWIKLFDGTSTKGWTPRAKVETFEAKNGELHLLTKTNCWVTSDIKMANFEAELEVLLPPEPGFNSEIGRAHV